MADQLNSLLNSNNQIKKQVSVSRNSRVIYSNVYKNLEKEIRKAEYTFKCCIIENIAGREVLARI